MSNVLFSDINNDSEQITGCLLILDVAVSGVFTVGVCTAGQKKLYSCADLGYVRRDRHKPPAMEEVRVHRTQGDE